MKNMVLNMLVILVFLIALVVLVFFTNGVDELVDIFNNMQYVWIAAAFGCMIMYWAGEAVVIHTTTQYLFQKQKWKNSVKVTMIGQFFNAATPFASGGQAAQGYVMIKDGVKPGHTVLIIIIKSVSYQVVLLLYSLVILFFRGGFFLDKIPHFTLIFIAGLIANSFMISIYALFIFKKRTAAKILFFGINFLNRIKIIKKPFKYKKYLIKEVKMFGEGAAVLKENPILLLKTLMFHALRLTFFFSIPFFIFLAIEGTTADLFNMICSQAIVTMTASYVPLPGASGGAEGIGYLFFKLFFRKNQLISVILIWRLLTYYSNIVFGGLFTLLTPNSPLKKRVER